MKKLRDLWRKVRAACRVNLDYAERIGDDWCNLAHIHLDWQGYGDYSRQARLLFLREYARRFDQFARMFISQKREFQLWLLIYPHDSDSDCLFVHTPNPHSEFPLTLHGFTWAKPAQHLFDELLPYYTMVEGISKNGPPCLIYYAQEIGAPLGVCKKTVR